MTEPWSEIIPGLWMGGDERSPVGEFDHVVSLCPWGEQCTPGPPGQTEWFIPDAELPDDAEEHIWRIARDVSDRLDRGEAVLVRCQMGINRSGLIVAATLLVRGWSPPEAIAQVRRRRDPLALSNAFFTGWLDQQVVL